MKGSPFLLWAFADRAVFDICINEIIPSSIRVPPLVITEITGRFFFVACSKASEIFSPTTFPIDPPINPKSKIMSITGEPLIEHFPVTTASVSPVLVWL